MSDKQYPKSKFGHNHITLDLHLFCDTCGHPLLYEQNWDNFDVLHHWVVSVAPCKACSERRAIDTVTNDAL